MRWDGSNGGDRKDVSDRGKCPGVLALQAAHYAGQPGNIASIGFGGKLPFLYRVGQWKSKVNILFKVVLREGGAYYLTQASIAITFGMYC